MNTSRIMPPCVVNGKPCENRKAGCHSSCEAYLLYKVSLDERNDEILKRRVSREITMTDGKRKRLREYNKFVGGRKK